MRAVVYAQCVSFIGPTVVWLVVYEANDVWWLELLILYKVQVTH